MWNASTRILSPSKRSAETAGLSFNVEPPAASPKLFRPESAHAQAKVPGLGTSQSVNGQVNHGNICSNQPGAHAAWGGGAAWSSAPTRNMTSGIAAAAAASTHADKWDVGDLDEDNWVTYDYDTHSSKRNRVERPDQNNTQVDHNSPSPSQALSYLSIYSPGGAATTRRHWLGVEPDADSRQPADQTAVRNLSQAFEQRLKQRQQPSYEQQLPHHHRRQQQQQQLLLPPSQQQKLLPSLQHHHNHRLEQQPTWPHHHHHQQQEHSQQQQQQPAAPVLVPTPSVPTRVPSLTPDPDWDKLLENYGMMTSVLNGMRDPAMKGKLAAFLFLSYPLRVLVSSFQALEYLTEATLRLLPVSEVAAC